MLDFTIGNLLLVTAGVTAWMFVLAAGMMALAELVGRTVDRMDRK